MTFKFPAAEQPPVPMGFQVMPPLAPEERVELEASIRAHGVQVPISVSADGVIVDGHHRDEIARRHGLHCPRVVVDGDAAKLRGLAFSLNLHRRHLTSEQKRAVVAESIKADPQLSDREHGRRTGVDHKTAAGVRESLTESGEIPHFSERVDPRTGNASQPATKPRHEITLTDEDGDDIGSMVDDRDPADMSDQDWIDAAYDAEAEAEDSLDYQPVTQEPAAPTQPRRRPLPESFDTAVFNLKRTVDTVARLSRDDRLEKNKDQVKASNLSDLVRVRDAINGVINTLEG